MTGRSGYNHWIVRSRLRDACVKASSRDERFPDRRAWIKSSLTGQITFREGSRKVCRGISRLSFGSRLKVWLALDSIENKRRSVLLLVLLELEGAGKLDAVDRVLTR